MRRSCHVRSEAARHLFTAIDGGDAKTIAGHVASICQLLCDHVSRLVGDIGTRTLFLRSLVLGSVAFPGLKNAVPTTSEQPYDGLRRWLESAAPATATATGIHVFETFIELLERFIGVGLVANLLHDVWPAIFDLDTKETK